MNNPYTPRSPLLDARMFAGRAYDLVEIGAFLNGNQSVSIVGPHQIGKTSFLWHLMRSETRTAAGIGENTLLVYIDCHALSVCRKEEIFAHFCTEMAKALRSQGLPPEAAIEAAVTKPTWTGVEAVLRKLNQRGLRVVLMLDDFEQLSLNPQVDLSFYNALRSAAGRLRLAFLTCSTRPLIELTYFDPPQTILSSPFFNIFAQVFLGLLSESEARSLIQAPVETAGRTVNPQLADFIYPLVGGHPLALQIACFHAWDSPGDLTWIERQALLDLAPFFQSEWQALSPAEREVMRSPIEAGAQAAGNPALALILRGLLRNCLLVQAGGSYQYPSKAWMEFVADRIVPNTNLELTHP